MDNRALGLSAEILQNYMVKQDNFVFFLQLICVYTSFITYFVVKFISIVVTFKVFFRKKNMAPAKFLTNYKTTHIENYHIESTP